MPFDFKYNEATGNLEKIGYYSRCVEREASREEALLWRRVEDLEAILNERCSTPVQDLLHKIEAATTASRVELNPVDFALLRLEAAHRIEIATAPSLNRNRILAYLPTLNDGSPSCVWVGVDRSVPIGSIRVVE